MLTTLEKKNIFRYEVLPEFTAGRTGKLRVVLLREEDGAKR